MYVLTCNMTYIYIFLTYDIYLYINTYITYIKIYILKFTASLAVHIYINICIAKYTYIHMHVCVYVYVCVCECVYMTHSNSL